jgi:hypothetical protein
VYDNYFRAKHFRETEDLQFEQSHIRAIDFRAADFKQFVFEQLHSSNLPRFVNFSNLTERCRLTPHGFETLRILAVVLAMCLKLVLMPSYLQAYLDMAYNRTQEQKKEAGRITNVEFQKKVRTKS